MKSIADLRASMPWPIKIRYRALRSFLQLVKYSLYDFTRFRRYSACSVVSQTTAQEDAEITRAYHTIEKGLSIRSPRPGFGSEVIRRLCATLRRRIEADGPWTQACQDAVDALTGYADFNHRRGVGIIAEATTVLELAKARGIAAVGLPTVQVYRADIRSATSFDAKAFFASRHSVRQFEPGPIDEQRLRRAVSHALTTPSVCNRQCGRVKIAIRGQCDLDFLSLQNGNRGFGHEAQAVAIVTADLSVFLDSTERQQAMVDGGMFAMMLALGLHAEGFGACFLNWSQTIKADIALREATGIPECETVITLLAVGNLPSSFAVARSHRIGLDRVISKL